MEWRPCCPLVHCTGQKGGTQWLGRIIQSDQSISFYPDISHVHLRWLSSLKISCLCAGLLLFRFFCAGCKILEIVKTVMSAKSITYFKSVKFVESVKSGKSIKEHWIFDIVYSGMKQIICFVSHYFLFYIFLVELVAGII